MNILFIGCVKSSYVLLEKLLINNKNICGVVTKKESNFNADYEDLIPLCEKYNIEIEYTNDINDDKTIKFIKDKNPDIIYCFGWSQLLKKQVINIPKLGVVGFHPTKLPNNKGRHPVIWTLVLGLTDTASTFFMIDEAVDNGEIVSQYSIKVDLHDDANDLYNKILLVAGHQVIEFTEQFENNKVNFIKQNQLNTNTWRKRTKEDGKIDFRMSALNIYNLVRGLTKPYVGAHLVFEGKEYKVWRCEVVKDVKEEYSNIEFGKVLQVYSPTSFLVRSGKDLIKIIDCDETDLKVGDYL
ncbi:formyltransferase family protein [Pelotomaculum propionicicum]|uniref:formyltransferase family protein n=1 Tax=Pelotomaculum propionicicum TaxID=258475 RepID=UPI003B7AEF5B